MTRWTMKQLLTMERGTHRASCRLICIAMQSRLLTKPEQTCPLVQAAAASMCASELSVTINGSAQVHAMGVAQVCWNLLQLANAMVQTLHNGQRDQQAQPPPGGSVVITTPPVITLVLSLSMKPDVSASFFWGWCSVHCVHCLSKIVLCSGCFVAEYILSRGPSNAVISR